MKKKTLITILIIVAVIIAVYVWLKRKKKSRESNTVVINDLSKGSATGSALQLLAQSANGANSTVLPGQDGFPLKMGSKGVSVAKLQVALMANVTGLFDADTERKVIAAIGKNEVSEEKYKYLIEVRQWQPFLSAIPSVHNAKLSDEYYKTKVN